jgi:hypothetical protein
MSVFDRYTTTELFNIFHDDYKDDIEPHWAEKFRELSGVSKEQTDACYWHNTEIPNNEEANKRLVAFLDELDYLLCCKEDNHERDCQ